MHLIESKYSTKAKRGTKIFVRGASSPIRRLIATACIVEILCCLTPDLVIADVN
jgi:hypothetical protein